MSVGENIKKYRKKANLTQKELAYKVDMSEISIRRYEKEINIPTLKVLDKIAAALGVSYNELMENDWKPFIQPIASEKVDTVFSVVEYVNKHRCQNKYNLSQILDTDAIMDISSLIEDITLNRLRHYSNIKNIKDSNDDK